MAGSYQLGRGFTAAYPETTGYIIPTLLASAQTFQRPALRTRALQMGEWLLSIQDSSGAFPGGLWKPKGPYSLSVFNSGQILFGLVALFFATEDPRYQTAGLRCAQWLAAMQDADGAWRRFTYKNQLHTYYVRVSWALGLAALAFDAPSLRDAARKNIEFTLSCHRGGGWYAHCAFRAGALPVLHTYAYLITGLLETGVLLDHPQARKAAVEGSERLLAIQCGDGSLPGAIAPDFSGPSYRCLTGIAQTAINWGRIQAHGLGTTDWASAVERALTYLSRAQVKRSPLPLAGAFAGSRPVWGPYMFLRYPNWAAKFFVDAVLVQMEAMDRRGWG